MVHIAKMSKSPQENRQQRGQGYRKELTNYTEDHHDVLHTGPTTASAMFVALNMNGTDVAVELDTGSSVTIDTRAMWLNIGSPKLSVNIPTLRSSTGHFIKLLGATNVIVQHGKP